MDRDVGGLALSVPLADSIAMFRLDLPQPAPSIHIHHYAVSMVHLGAADRAPPISALEKKSQPLPCRIPKAVSISDAAPAGLVATYLLSCLYSPAPVPARSQQPSLSPHPALSDHQQAPRPHYPNTLTSLQPPRPHAHSLLSPGRLAFRDPANNELPYEEYGI